MVHKASFPTLAFRGFLLPFRRRASGSHGLSNEPSLPPRQRSTVDAMALFSRRFLQWALDGSKSYLSEKQRQGFCNRLNTVRDNYLSTEWELAGLHALNTLGSLRYEPAFPGMGGVL